MEPITAAPGDEAASYVEQNVMGVVSEAIDRILANPPPIGTEVAVFESYLRAMNPRRLYRERVMTLPKLPPPPKPKAKKSVTIRSTAGSTRTGTAGGMGFDGSSSVSGAPNMLAQTPPGTAPNNNNNVAQQQQPSSLALNKDNLSLPAFSVPTNSDGTAAVGGNNFTAAAATAGGANKSSPHADPNAMTSVLLPKKREIKALPSQFTLKFMAVESGKGGGSSASVKLQRREEQEQLKRLGIDTTPAESNISVASRSREGSSAAPAHRKQSSSHGDGIPAITLDSAGAFENSSSLHDTADNSRRSSYFASQNAAPPLELLDKCKELPIFVGDFPWTDDQLKVMIEQLALTHQMTNITFVVASTPSVAVKLDDGFMYRAEVGTQLWNMATRQLIEEVLMAQDPKMALVRGGAGSPGSGPDGEGGANPKLVSPRGAANKSPEVELTDFQKYGITPQAFGARMNATRTKEEKAVDLLAELGVDPKVLADAEYEETDRARRVDNARRRNVLQGGISKLRNLVENVMENRRRTREQIAQGMHVAKSKAETLLGGETINTNALLNAIDDEKLESALIKYLFPVDKNAKRPSITDRSRRDSSPSALGNSPSSFVKRRSVSYSDGDANSPAPMTLQTARSFMRRDKDKNGENNGTGGDRSAVFSERAARRMSASGVGGGGSGGPLISSPSMIMGSRMSTNAMAHALKRSKSFGLAETALRAARERRAENEMRLAMSVTSSLMTLRDAARSFVDENPSARVVFKYHRLFHPTGTPVSQRATDRLYDILSTVPKVHDACIVILGFNQSVLLRHIAALSSIYFKIVREVQTVNRAFTLFDVQDRVNPHIDVEAQKRRLARNRAERDARRAAIAESIRPKMRAIEQVESPQECKLRLETARSIRNERVERRQRNDEALTAIDFVQRYNAAVKVQACFRGWTARKLVNRMMDKDADEYVGPSATETYVSPAQMIFKEFREGKSPFFQNCVAYLQDALGTDMVATKMPSRSFNRTMVLHEKRRVRVPPANEDDISSEDEQWTQKTVTHIVPDTHCAINPSSAVIAALQSAGSDDISYLVEVIAEYRHVEPMQRKASAIMEKLIHYIMFAAFAALRIKLEFGYAASPGTLASSVFLQVPSRYQPITTFSDWMLALPLPIEWSRQFSMYCHAYSKDPYPLLSHRMLLGGPLPNGQWIADEPDGENPAIAAAAVKAAAKEHAASDSVSNASAGTPMYGRSLSTFNGQARAAARQSFRDAKRATLQPSASAGTPSASLSAPGGASASTSPTAVSMSTSMGILPPPPPAAAPSHNKDDYCIICPRRMERFDASINTAMQAPIFIVPEYLSDLQWEEAAKALLKGELGILGPNAQPNTGGGGGSPSKGAAAAEAAAKQRFNRIVWVSTCAHPCVVVNGNPMYLPERKSIRQRHCINNPTVKDSKALRNEMPDPLCYSTLNSFAVPTSVPAPRSIHQLATQGQQGGGAASASGGGGLGSGKKSSPLLGARSGGTLKSRATRTHVILSEMPLLSIGVAKEDRPVALPPRLLLSGTSAPNANSHHSSANNKVSTNLSEKKPHHIYLSEIEAAIIAELVEKVPENGGVLDYHPAYFPPPPPRPLAARQHQQQQSPNPASILLSAVSGSITSPNNALATGRFASTTASTAMNGLLSPTFVSNTYGGSSNGGGGTDPNAVDGGSAAVGGDAQCAPLNPFDMFKPYWDIPTEVNQKHVMRVSQRERERGAYDDLTNMIGELGYDMIWGGSQQRSAADGTSNTAVAASASTTTITNRRNTLNVSELGNTPTKQSNNNNGAKKPALLPNIRHASLAVDETTHRFGLRKPSPVRMRVLQQSATLADDSAAQNAALAREAAEQMTQHGGGGSNNYNAAAGGGARAARAHNGGGGGGNPLLAPINPLNAAGSSTAAAAAADPSGAASRNLMGLPNRTAISKTTGIASGAVGPRKAIIKGGNGNNGNGNGANDASGSNYLLGAPTPHFGGVNGGGSIRYSAIAKINRLPRQANDAFTSLPAVASRIRTSLRRIIDERFGIALESSRRDSSFDNNSRDATNGGYGSDGGATHHEGEGEDDEEGNAGGANGSHGANTLPGSAAAAAASVTNISGSAGINCFKYHRVPLKYGHMGELATVLGDIYEMIVSNADEPKTAFVFGFSDPIRSLVATTAATIIYDIDLRRSYQRAELQQNESSSSPHSGLGSKSHSGPASGAASPKGVGIGSNALSPSQASLTALGLTSPNGMFSRRNMKEAGDQQPALPPPLPKRPLSMKPNALEMFPFLSRIADENIAVEVGRASTTLDEILVDTKSYDAIIGDAARSVMYAVLVNLPDEESLAAPVRPSVFDDETVDVDLGDGTIVQVPISPRTRREAQRLAKEADEEAEEEKRIRDLVMSLPQLRYCRRVLLEWLEALKPEGWDSSDPMNNGGEGVDGGGAGFIPTIVSTTAAGINSQPPPDPSPFASPRPVVVPNPDLVTPASASPSRQQQYTPFGPIIPLDEASRRFEQYFTLVLFASFVRVSCDARRVNAATGKPLPRFEDHVFPQPAINSLTGKVSASLGLTVGAAAANTTPAGATVNHQLTESLRYGVDMWEGPLRLSGESLDGDDGGAGGNSAKISPLHSARGRRRGLGGRRASSNLAQKAAAAAAASAAIEALSVTNCCVESDPKRKKRIPNHGNDNLIDVATLMNLGKPPSNAISPMGGGGGGMGNARSRSRSISPAAMAMRQTIARPGGATATSPDRAAGAPDTSRGNNLASLLASAAHTNSSDHQLLGPMSSRTQHNTGRHTTRSHHSGPSGGPDADASTLIGAASSGLVDDLGGSDWADEEEPYEEVVHPLSTAAAALARPFTVFDLEYEGVKIWKSQQYAMHVIH